MLTSKSLVSLSRFLVESDLLFELHQRNKCGATLLMQAIGKPRRIYEELIRLGADVKALDQFDSTVLHHFLINVFGVYNYDVSIDVFLDGGEILALLVQAGVDPQATDRFGRRPQDASRTSSSFPRRRIQNQVNLAF